MKESVLSIKEVRRFFEVNGMDTLEDCHIEVACEFAGQEFCDREEAYRALGYFQSLYPDLIRFCKVS